MKNNKTMSRIITVILAICMAFGVCTAFAGCNSRYKVTVRLAKPTIAVGGTTTALVAIAGTDDQEYTLSSSNSKVASVDEDGVITGHMSGTVDIIATAHADGKSSGKATLIVGSGVSSDDGTTEKGITVKAALTAGQNDRLSSVGDTTSITTEVVGSKETGCTFTVGAGFEDYISVDANGVITVKKLPEDFDIFPKVIVTFKADPTRSITVSFRLEAPYIAGQVGDMTSKMIEDITNPSITIAGTITDVHDDVFKNSNDYTNVYNTKVEMEEGKWKSTWQIASAEPGVTYKEIVTMFAANNDNIMVKPDEGMIDTSGKTMSSVYIDKNNQVAHQTVTSYDGRPVLWVNNCLYNMFKELPIASFEVAEDTDIDGNPIKYPGRTYHLKKSATNELVMVRLAVSMSELFTTSDIFSGFYFVLNEQKTAIEKIMANTERIYDTGRADTATTVDWTETELTLSKIGTTTVSDPTPFEAEAKTPVLQSALTAMRGLDSYFYKAVDTTTGAPSVDPDDYEYSDYSLTSSAKANANARDIEPDRITGNKTINVGTAGEQGWVVANEGVVKEYVSKYSYTMDGNDTKYEYSGYRAYDDKGYYEKFDWVGKNEETNTPGHFRGIQKINGNMKNDLLPSFDFAAEVFKWMGTTTKGDVFKLQSDNIMADIAQAVSMYNYASNAYVSTRIDFTITVKDGKVVETSYPYNINGNYFGYVTTTYSRFGATVLPMLDTGDVGDTVRPIFDSNYKERVFPTAWEDLWVKHYHIDHSTISGYDASDAETAMRASYGDDKFVTIPTPNVLLYNVFGDIFDASIWKEDGFSGPFFDWVEKDENSYYDIYTFTCRLEDTGAYYPSQEYWAQLTEDLIAVLKPCGYTLNPAQTGNTSEYEGVGNRYITFINTAGMTISVENNYSNNLWIYIYETGAITRSTPNPDAD